MTSTGHVAITILATTLSMAVAACAAGDEATGIGAPTSTGTGTGGAGGAGGGGTGGSAPQGDALPANAVSFFQGTNCPKGWAIFEKGGGRMLLPTSDAKGVGAVYGEALDPGEDRTHKHGIKGSFNFPEVSYVGAPGGGNSGVAAAGKTAFTATSKAASTGLPYVQMLACKKVSQPSPQAGPPAAGMTMFFEAPECPGGWATSDVTKGRLLVGLPKGAPADKPFGGEPLVAMDEDAGAPPATHTHGNGGKVTTTPHGIALASGCCGGGYAKNGEASFSQATDEAEAGLPYIALLHCVKQ